eukprot:s847_g25.t1
MSSHDSESWKLCRVSWSQQNLCLAWRRIMKKLQLWRAQRLAKPSLMHHAEGESRIQLPEGLEADSQCVAKHGSKLTLSIICVLCFSCLQMLLCKIEQRLHCFWV